jgi:hypothetical protein
LLRYLAGDKFWIEACCADSLHLPRSSKLEKRVRLRLKSNVTPEDLLDKVVDQESFIAFVSALAAEREEAEQLERDDPTRYQLGGAHNWQNGNISAFLYASRAYFSPKPFHQPENQPTWKMIAEIFYYGKIYE